jgi:hypothetical protein
MPFVWTAVTLEAWLWTLGAALFGGIAQYFMIESFNYAPAATLRLSIISKSVAPPRSANSGSATCPTVGPFLVSSLSSSPASTF